MGYNATNKHRKTLRDRLSVEKLWTLGLEGNMAAVGSLGFLTTSHIARQMLVETQNHPQARVKKKIATKSLAKGLAQRNLWRQKVSGCFAPGMGSREVVAERYEGSWRTRKPF